MCNFLLLQPAHIYVTHSAKKVHKSLYAFTRTGPFYVERVTISSNKQFLREGIFNILDTYIFILHNQKCWFQSIKTEKECVCVECFIYCLSFCSFKRHVSTYMYVISRNVRKYICKFPNILRMQNATDLNHISNESLSNGLSVYI